MSLLPVLDVKCFERGQIAMIGRKLLQLVQLFVCNWLYTRSNPFQIVNVTFHLFFSNSGKEKKIFKLFKQINHIVHIHGCVVFDAKVGVVLVSEEIRLHLSLIGVIKKES